MEDGQGDGGEEILYNLNKFAHMFHIHWHITNTCNLRCKHCYQYTFSDIYDLPFEQLKEIAKNIVSGIKKLNKNLAFTITGGEPILREDLSELIDFLKSFNIVKKVGVITNGMKLNEKIIDKLDYIYVSLDGADKETNDYLRGAGTFNHVIQYLKHIKQKNKFVLMFTMMKKNIHSALNMLELAASLSLGGVIYEKFMPLGRGEKIRNEVLSGEEIKSFYQSMFNIFSIKFTDDLAKYKALYVDLRNKKELKVAECIVGRCGACILPEGTILPCRRFYYGLGNLLKNDFIEIWKNSLILKAVRSRKKLKGKCRDCRIENCYGCRAMAYCVKGDFLEEDPSCWL